MIVSGGREKEKAEHDSLMASMKADLAAKEKERAAAVRDKVDAEANLASCRLQAQTKEAALEDQMLRDKRAALRTLKETEVGPPAP